LLRCKQFSQQIFAGYAAASPNPTVLTLKFINMFRNVLGFCWDCKFWTRFQHRR